MIVDQSINFLKSFEYGKYAEQILSFYVPLVLSLPQLRENPELMRATIRAMGQTGVADVVTAVDIITQQKIKENVIKLHPDWQFWGEEGEDNVSQYDSSKEYLLITDPIEGTNNFRAGKDDQWGSVIAFVDIKSRQPVVGIVAHTSRKQFYVGIKGGGAFMLSYGESGQLKSTSPMNSIPEFDQFTYNNSPHFNPQLSDQVERFMALGKVQANLNNTDYLEKSRRTVIIPQNGAPTTFVDPESGALEAVRYRGTIYFKTSNEMAAVFVILGELGGRATDADGNPWTLGINTLIAARTDQDYKYLKSLFESVQS